ncbi:MAG TPA: polysaccharide biosynthesis C-terminal domain-containing protein [Gemmatimonadales bacterium]|nr:polysaccharide biosynthesis C-terminal domain-containing protein [Gemmatimonadales bacterium]
MKVGPAFLQTFVSQVIQSAASIATGILVARTLGPAGQGQYAVLVAAVGLLSTLACIGQFEGNVLNSAGERSRGRILLLRSLLQALAAVVVLALSEGLWRRGLGLEGDRVLTTLFLLLLTCEVLALLFRGINLGQHEVTAYNVSTLVQRIAFLVGVAAFLVVHEARLKTVLIAWLGAVALAVSTTGVWIWRRSGSAVVSWAAVREGWSLSLKRGMRALLTIGLTLVLLRTDVYMLGPMLGANAVGQVSVASTFAEYLWYIPSILGSVLFAAVAASRGPRTVGKICLASRTTVALLTPIALALVLVGPGLVPAVYGAAYAQAGTIFLLLLPGMFAISLHLVIDSYFAGSGYPPISYLATGAALVLKVALNLALVPSKGIAGAAVATSIVYAALLTAKVVAFSRETGTDFTSLFRPTLSDVANNLLVARSWLRGGAHSVTG